MTQLRRIARSISNNTSIKFKVRTIYCSLVMTHFLPELCKAVLKVFSAHILCIWYIVKAAIPNTTASNINIFLHYFTSSIRHSLYRREGEEPSFLLFVFSAVCKQKNLRSVPVLMFALLKVLFGSS